MSALYQMTYVGVAGVGGGIMYIGNGKVAGADVALGRYRGTYTEADGGLRLTAVMSLPAGSLLVTGATVPVATDLPLTATWPLNFDNGQTLQISVAGQPVQVKFEKIMDVP